MPFPRSAFDKTLGLIYFARMCDKIRLHVRGELPPDYHEQLGTGFDGRMCGFLQVDYPALRDHVLGGADDEAALAWCQQNGRKLSELDILIWNGFAKKRGWHDDDGGTEALEKYKAASGLTHRDDLQTFFDYYEVDEKRRP